MLLDKGTLNGQRILSAAAVEAMTSSYAGSMKAGFAPGVGHGFGFEVVREALGTFRYNSIGSFVKGGAYAPTGGWTLPKIWSASFSCSVPMVAAMLLTRSTVLWRWRRRLSSAERDAPGRYARAKSREAH